MFKNKTVFVVGAGASKEFGLPLGSELKDTIAHKANIEFSELSQQITGDDDVAGSLRHTEAADKLEEFFAAGRRLAHAMPQAISIDNYLESHSDNEATVKVGRLCIAASIMEAEAASDLAKWKTGGENFSLSRYESTWMNVFVKMLAENVPRRSIETIFDNVAIITFNYDRCIEHYLMMALTAYYHITPKESQALCKSLTILHPYGKIGALEWQSEKVLNPFGRVGSQHTLASIASRIRTFSERMEEETQVDEIHRLIGAAEKIVYLGFSFGRMNMDLMATEASTGKNIFATAYGLSGPNETAIRRMIADSVGRGRQHTINFTSATCCEFLAAHWNPILYS